MCPIEKGNTRGDKNYVKWERNKTRTGSMKNGRKRLSKKVNDVKIILK